MAYVVETEKLTKQYGEFVAVDSLSLQIEEGQIYGFLGPNGSGKSTTIRMLCGLIFPTSGRGYVLGLPLGGGNLSIRSCIGYMSQKFSLYPSMTVIENLHLYAGLYSLQGNEKKTRISAMLEMAGLQDRQGEYARNLSGGWRQRLALGCAIMHRPKMLFLDEPTSGVDPKGRQSFWDLIYDLAHLGTTIMVTTHFMDEAEHCDRVAFIYKGKLIVEGAPHELKTNIKRHLIECYPKDSMQLLEKIKTAEHEAIQDAYIVGARLRILSRVALSEIQENPIFSGINMKQITPSMEDVFVQLTKSHETSMDGR